MEPVILVSEGEVYDWDCKLCFLEVMLDFYDDVILGVCLESGPDVTNRLSGDVECVLLWLLEILVRVYSAMFNSYEPGHPFSQYL